jgi:hypothetical protein
MSPNAHSSNGSPNNNKPPAQPREKKARTYLRMRFAKAYNGINLELL